MKKELSLAIFLSTKERKRKVAKVTIGVGLGATRQCKYGAMHPSLFCGSDLKNITPIQSHSISLLNSSLYYL